MDTVWWVYKQQSALSVGGLQINKYLSTLLPIWLLCKLSGSSLDSWVKRNKGSTDEGQATSWVLRTLLGSRQEYPQKYLSTSIHTRTHIHTYIGTGPASRICLQRRLSLNLISGYRRIQTKTARFFHSRGSHAVNQSLSQMASNPLSTMPLWSW